MNIGTPSATPCPRRDGAGGGKLMSLAAPILRPSLIGHPPNGALRHTTPTVVVVRRSTESNAPNTIGGSVNA